MPLIVSSAQMPQKLCKNSKKRDTVPTNVSFFAKLLLFPSKIPKNEERIIYSSNPQLSSSASFLRLNVLSSLN